MELISSWLGLIESAHWSVLFLLSVFLLFTLGKGADILVNETVLLAERTGIPKIIIGATIVSLGTTTPETAVSVMAAMQGDPSLVLGNVVGSIIADTGLILGIACLIAPIKLDRWVVNHQGWIQVGAGLLLVILSLVFQPKLPQAVGFFLLVALVIYITVSIWWSRNQTKEDKLTLIEKKLNPSESSLWTVLKLGFGISLVLISSRLLIPTVTAIAVRLNIPSDILAVTLVAIGTSLPELVTAVTASLKRQGEVALGNVIGADILNVLFVAGSAIAVTPNGLEIPGNFFKLHFPFMILILLVFRLGIAMSKGSIGRRFGILMVGLYIVYMGLQSLLI